MRFSLADPPPLHTFAYLHEWHTNAHTHTHAHQPNIPSAVAQKNTPSSVLSPSPSLARSLAASALTAVYIHILKSIVLGVVCSTLSHLISLYDYDFSAVVAVILLLLLPLLLLFIRTYAVYVFVCVCVQHIFYLCARFYVLCLSSLALLLSYLPLIGSVK